MHIVSTGTFDKSRKFSLSLMKHFLCLSLKKINDNVDDDPDSSEKRSYSNDFLHSCHEFSHSALSFRAKHELNLNLWPFLPSSTLSGAITVNDSENFIDIFHTKLCRSSQVNLRRKKIVVSREKKKNFSEDIMKSFRIAITIICSLSIHVNNPQF